MTNTLFDSIDPTSADSRIDQASSLRYWRSVPATVNGMLGGFPQVSRIDLRGSANFLAKLRRLKPATESGEQASDSTKKLARGVDCGAGIGRITNEFLRNVCEVVDIVEPVEKFAQVIRRSDLVKDGVVGDIFVMGLQDWVPPEDRKYDLIWVQWCAGYLTDAQFVEFLVRCRGALSPSGFIVVKENLSTDPDGNDMFDEQDSSTTRTDDKFKRLFQQAGMVLVKSEEQLGFPKRLHLLPVRSYALRPRESESQR
ncbi:hypothetical protein VTN49DRAFT_4087 [Thermomyces lanuginosus]|uniref:uncharacterized protein n=1 Tax=Thermomyces lanuginosus TaxID=5541 RepID=UPI0037434F45